jgi:hypothetical protein
MVVCPPEVPVPIATLSHLHAIKQFFWRRCRGLKKKLPRQPRGSNNFSGVVASEKEDSSKGSLSLPIFFTLLLFCLHLFIKNTKKFSSFIVVIFTCLLFSLARMSNPEVEVCTF